MNIRRRQFLRLAGLGAGLAVGVRTLRAEAYPSRPVHMIVGQAAGSSSDLSARLIAQYLSEHLGQQFVVDIRPGATGNIATEAVVRSAPDGYTILLINSQNTINAALFTKLNFDFVHDIAPIALVAPRAAGDGGQSGVPGRNGSGIHCLCEGQSGQDQYGVGGNWRSATCRRRTVQVHGRRRSRPRAIPRLDAGFGRSDGRSGAGHVRRDALVAAAHQSGQAAAARRHYAGAHGYAAGHSGHGGIFAWL